MTSFPTSLRKFCAGHPGCHQAREGVDGPTDADDIQENGAWRSTPTAHSAT